MLIFVYLMVWLADAKVKFRQEAPVILHFLGTGEACDGKSGNTSIIAENSETSILLDCGFTTPHRYFARVNDADLLDLVWISHYHGDHFFGLPLLLLRFWEMGRQKRLTIAGPEGLEDMVGRLFELAYAGFALRLAYPLSFKEMAPGEILHGRKLSLLTAATIHSQRNLALRLEFGGKKIFYSGDGRPSEASEKLMYGCDVLIHEAYQLSAGMEQHGSVKEIVALGKKVKPSKLIFVHVSRKVRPGLSDFLQTRAEDLEPTVMLAPEDGDSLLL